MAQGISNSEIVGMMLMMHIMPDITADPVCSWRTRDAVTSIGTQGLLHALHWSYHFYCDACLWDHVHHDRTR